MEPLERLGKRLDKADTMTEKGASGPVARLMRRNEMLAANETEMVFDRKADALRVRRRLADHGILSRYVCEGRGSNWLRILVPEKYEARRVWELAQKLYFERNDPR